MGLLSSHTTVDSPPSHTNYTQSDLCSHMEPIVSSGSSSLVCGIIILKVRGQSLLSYDHKEDDDDDDVYCY